ncbi:MAG: 16S rRNA (guanine(966)-N(2))-methyltransferase RsmD [Clostridiales bacterium]|nr:16S rRNA (guanine(966)-N(2))-methyltransferase RsmD [Clostridiales bacterium]
MRIIAGIAKGQTLQTLEGNATRPTLDRVKETLFGIIQFDLIEKNVLDLFAGSGSLGFEALSRGAKFATFIDNNAKCTAIIKNNAEKLKLTEKCACFQADYKQALSQLSSRNFRFDMVFLDPPYKSDLATDAIQTLIDFNMLNQDAIIVVEHSNDVSIPLLSGMKLKTTRKFHQTSTTLFEYNGVVL